MRIGLIGADRIQVSIRPAHDDAELLVLVDRLEQLIDAGYHTIGVALEGPDAPDDEPRSSTRPRPVESEGTGT